MQKKKPKLEFRYYKTSEDIPFLVLLEEQCHKIRNTRENIHFHNYLEIGYCFDGEGKILLEDDICYFRARSYYFIPRNYPHRIISSSRTGSKWEYLYVDVEKFVQQQYKNNPAESGKMVSDIQKKMHCCGHDDLPFLGESIIKILKLMRSRQEYYLEETMQLIWILLLEIGRMNKEDKQKIYNEKKIAVVWDAVSFIEKNYASRIKVGELAALCNLSESHFRKQFLNCMRMSPVEYINFIRICMACEEIRKTGDPINVIAYRCGFATPSAFCRCFKKYAGVPPKVWKSSPENWEGKLLDYTISVKDGW